MFEALKIIGMLWLAASIICLAIAAAFLLEGPVRDLLEHVRHRLRKLPS
jgi:hypothetical protein